MSTKEKGFHAASQIKKDLLLVVRNMTGIVDVAKKLFKLQEKLEILKEKQSTVINEHKIIKEAREIIEDEKLKEKLDKEIIKQQLIVIATLNDNIDSIETKIKELKEEFNEYVDYSVVAKNGFDKMGSSFLSNRVVLSIDELTNDEIIAYYCIKGECPKNYSLENEKDPERKRILQICHDDNGKFDKFQHWLENGMHESFKLKL